MIEKSAVRVDGTKFGVFIENMRTSRAFVAIILSWAYFPHSATAQDINEELVLMGTCRIQKEEFFLYHSAADRSASVTVFHQRPDRPIETVTAEWRPTELRLPKYWRVQQVPASACQMRPAKVKANVTGEKGAIPSPLEVRGYWVSPAIPSSDATQIDQLVAREDAIPLTVGVICSDGSQGNKEEFRACSKIKLVSSNIVKNSASPAPNPFSAIFLPFSATE